ncbi:MAG: hypothetical protein K1W34_00115 [Lachnospiraceae bacterium]
MKADERFEIMILQQDRMEAVGLSVLEANMELLSTIPEEHQKEIQRYLLVNFCQDNPYKPLSRNEIIAELAESRACYNNGEGEDFDKALDEIGEKYGL